MNVLDLATRDIEWQKPAHRRAARLIRDAFRRSIISGGGGRGGTSDAVYNKARRNAELVACIFADFFGETDKGFDPSLFFRGCCMTDAFIDRMRRAKLAFELAHQKSKRR